MAFSRSWPGEDWGALLASTGPQTAMSAAAGPQGPNNHCRLHIGMAMQTRSTQAIPRAAPSAAGPHYSQMTWSWEKVALAIDDPGNHQPQGVRCGS